MKLYDVIRAWVATMPTKLIFIYYNHFYHTLDDGGNMLSNVPYRQDQVPDREVGNPGRILVMSDREFDYKITHNIFYMDDLDLLAKINIYWGDTDHDWIREAVESSVKKGYKHAYVLNNDDGFNTDRSCIYLDLCGYRVNTDWVKVENELQKWDKSMRYTQWRLSDKRGLNTMKLHDLLKQVSDILDPDDGVFDYFLHTFDDNGGFLRTRYCWLEQKVKDKEIPELSKVLICFEEEFDADGAFYCIDFDDINDETVLDRMSQKHKTVVRCELFYDSDQDAWIECNVENSRENGFGFAYLVDLKNRTYTVTGKSCQEYLADGTVM